MFTGIVEEVGKVKAVRPGGMTIGAQEALNDAKVGDSICVNGVCLTVTSFGGGVFTVDLMPETLRRTDLGSLHAGDGVNLERAIGVGGRFGGHFVQGHVEGLGRIMSKVPEGDAIILRFEAPQDLMHFIVSKGFVCVDGISLTVVDCDDTSFSVSLVAFTQENTILARKKPGDPVNLETDIIAKYVARLLQGTSQITPKFLEETGFAEPGRGWSAGPQLA